MRLRCLQPHDAEWMLQWMYDADVVKYFQQNFQEKTLADCQRFIAASAQSEDALNLAIVDEADRYMGTVSLKHIDRVRGDAEFAIVLCGCAMGKGYSAFAMEQILAIGWKELGLKRIFWCVDPENKRAVRFYNKLHHCPTTAAEVDAARYYTDAQMEKLLWYQKEI